MQEQVLQQKSPAQFFAENKTAAGFDNPGKSLYTCMRELVENALDACEAVQQLPDIEVQIEEISLEHLNTVRGLQKHLRIDTTLYKDHESDEQKKKRESKGIKDKEKLDKLIQKKGEHSAMVESKKREIDNHKGQFKGKQFYRLTVKDNGIGMPYKDIPEMMGRVLSGTKYGVKQTRGKFGLGAKMALIWAKLTVGLPYQIVSAQPKSSYKSHYHLDIDIVRNQPHVLLQEKLSNEEHWQGSEVSLIIEGNWQQYRSYVLKYLRLIAVITPYSQFKLQYIGIEQKSSLNLTFIRRTQNMPPNPQTTKFHPSSVDLELIKRLLKASKCKTLLEFLRKEFVCIDKELAGRLIEEMQVDAYSSLQPQDLSQVQIVRLHQLLHQANFEAPKGDHLAPAGEYNMRLGVIKELQPEIIATHQSNVSVLEGHAFCVEGVVCLGGKDMKQGLSIFRYANRIPLLFEGGGDVITRTAQQRINWGSYKINEKIDRVGIFISIVSTKIPFKGAGKEYIGDDIQEIGVAVKSTIQNCCVQLKAKISKAQAAKEQQYRKKNFKKYIPGVAKSIFEVLEAIQQQRLKKDDKRQWPQSHTDLLNQLQNKKLKQDDLEIKLNQHIEQIDTDMAMEYQIQQGLSKGIRSHVFLSPQTSKSKFYEPLKSKVALVRFLKER